ncbi:FAD/NAD-binding domain-containing protein [Phellopilus nigrolimitatus]|nr:FAD/NAD-binding domain-containing protein [Phellopilus nigrolimitatus]
MPVNRPKFSIAICGGGISGLCLAVALSKYSDIEVLVYEAAERFKEIGAGVMIWTKTWTILELMGLADDFSKIAHAPPDGSIGFDYRRSDQPTEGFRFHIVEVPHGCIRFHRAQFLDVFVNHLSDKVTFFGKRLISYTDDGSEKMSLLFQDGSSAVCDALVGCDGIKSSIRRQLFESMAQERGDDFRIFIEPVWTGTTAYRGLIPADRVPKLKDGSLHSVLQRPMMYCGKSKHIVGYSIAQGDIVNVVTLISEKDKQGERFEGPWVSECSKQELLGCYAGWEPEVQDILQCIERPTKWALHELHPLPMYVSGKVALVGDSAHAMLPHQGAGAGQAIEDAYILAQILGSSLTTKNTLTDALKAYENVRLPMANNVLRGSKDSGLMYEFDYPGLGEDYARLGRAIQKQWDWVWASHPDEDVARGLACLKANLGSCGRH